MESPDLLSSRTPATLNVNSGLCLQFAVQTSRGFFRISHLTSRSRWHVARKSECTAQCGLGYRTLEIYCAKISHADGKTEKVDDRFCSGQQKPDNKEGCHGDCNPGGWEYSPWSEVGGGQT